MAKKYYSLKEILKADGGCTFNILLGQKGNGKSYAVKDYILQIAFNERDPFSGDPVECYQFAYFRRWDIELKAADIEQYFTDFIENDDGRRRIEEITDGEYSTISVYQKKIYFANVDEDTGKVIRGKHIGYVFSLARSSKYASLSYPKIGVGVFEEFITDEGYQPKEPSTFVRLLSTIFRHRSPKIFMIGNTLSRESPYFSEFQLINVPRQKQGTIDVYYYRTEDGEIIKIAVENCGTIDVENKFIIGRHQKMITTGQWESEEQPHLPEPLNHYKIVHVFFIETENLVYMGRILKDASSYLLYICPHTTGIKDRDRTRILTRRFSLNYLHASHLLTDKLKYDLIISELLNLGHVAYSDNLTGTEFKELLKKEGNFL